MQRHLTRIHALSFSWQLWQQRSGGGREMAAVVAAEALIFCSYRCGSTSKAQGNYGSDPSGRPQQLPMLLRGTSLRGAPPSNSTSSSRAPSFTVRATSDKPVKTQVNRQLWFASEQSLSYLDGTLAGDYGFDPLGLMDPEGAGGFMDPNWLTYAEIINGRYAMLGAVGAIAPEIFGKIGLIPQETALVWFKTGVFPPAGTYDYWADPYTLFFLEIALMGFAEHRRAQDYYKPGSMGKQYFLGLEKYLGGSGNPAYPGGPLFNFLGLGKDEKSLKDLKVKEVKNGRLAMLAIVGYFIQAPVTGVGPFQNLLDHLSDPFHNNLFTNLNLSYLL